MILKNLDYKLHKHEEGAYEEWNYFDNIVSASNYFDEDTKMVVVRCKFNNGNFVTIAVPCVAYLMSDNGKTIEKIYGATVEELGDTENAVYTTMQDAVEYAREQ